MKPVRTGYLIALLFCLPLAHTWAQSGLVEERVTEENGFYEACGEGAGLLPCRDINGQTYDEEVRGPSIDSESTDELAVEAARIRHESPAQLQQTIGELEQGINPDDHATEGLPH
ncbi:MAG: hypothetical protein DRR04_12255 [Gammaproteobacteria bacterium]|nr:MAG: hypothetical protein DRQ97_08700 [Gammaproteobacteria bacterium]RLA57776.1 MAG: hypothetical protein DRR04_12255 [Gammaproteobacteria bacterium]